MRWELWDPPVPQAKPPDPERSLYYPLSLDLDLDRGPWDDDDFDVDEGTMGGARVGLGWGWRWGKGVGLGGGAGPGGSGGGARRGGKARRGRAGPGDGRVRVCPGPALTPPQCRRAPCSRSAWRARATGARWAAGSRGCSRTTRCWDGRPSCSAWGAGTPLGLPRGSDCGQGPPRPPRWSPHGNKGTDASLGYLVSFLGVISVGLGCLLFLE